MFVSYQDLGDQEEQQIDVFIGTFATCSPKGCVYMRVGRCLCKGVCVQGEVVYVRVVFNLANLLVGG